MTAFHRTPAGPGVSGVFILGVLCAAGAVISAQPTTDPRVTFESSDAARNWNDGVHPPDIVGGIRVKYLQLGGQGFFGTAKDVEKPTFDGLGRFQEFSGGGIISWHPSHGAFAVWGLIAAKWTALGRERYGYPVTDELSTPNGDARYNDFRSMHLPNHPLASIYWTRWTGAYEVRGAIRDAWNQYRQDPGLRFIGYPISDEFATGRGAERQSNFQHGEITWTPSRGARVRSRVID